MIIKFNNKSQNLSRDMETVSFYEEQGDIYISTDKGTLRVDGEELLLAIQTLLKLSCRIE